MKGKGNIHSPGYSHVVADRPFLGVICAAFLYLGGKWVTGVLHSRYGKDHVEYQLWWASVVIHCVLGFTTSLSPRLASAYIFSDSWTPSPAMRMLGVVWATFGLLSVCALDRMQDFRLLLLVQYISICVWLVMGFCSDALNNLPVPLPLGCLLGKTSGLQRKARGAVRNCVF